ncbi:copper amine oxidase N-terminal domain-containing protein [Paenibacillus sp. NEAU-GSW1]|uniref:copper amine oxidase N-terminal domain-containing protein n=1 Tax=Paenibacillus sp. NEAU-GSW1 TaxID=2682486 RepID=UPI001563E09A|nr:copper amine oxidase N-terminal domain-containing protein [Paenibacillus sp. NEAU-GSW1]
MFPAALSAASLTEVSSAAKGELRSEAVIPLGSTTATVNGKKMTIQPIYEKNGTTLGPLNVIIRTLNLQFKLEGSNLTLWNKTYKPHNVWIGIGQTAMTLDGQSKKLSTPAEMKNGSVMVPFRAITEAFGGKITYNAKTKEVRMTVAAEPVIDKKLRVGDSTFGWSIGAPSFMRMIDQSETGDSISFSGKSGNNFGFNVQVTKGTKSSEIATVREDKLKVLHPSEAVIRDVYTFSLPMEYAFIETKQNQDFSNLYTQYWGMQANGNTYWVVLSFSDVTYEEERDRIAQALLKSFKPTIDIKDVHQLDYARKSKDQYTTLKNEKYGLNIQLPKGWKQNPDFSNPHFDAADLYTGTFSLKVVQLENGQELKDIVDKVQFEYFNLNGANLEERFYTTFQGNTAVKMRERYNGNEHWVTLLVSVVDDCAFIWSLSQDTKYAGQQASTGYQFDIIMNDLQIDLVKAKTQKKPWAAY